MDRVYLAITNFVTGRMSEKYVTPPVISFEAIFEQSNPFSPIIFILSPGSDPASDLMKLAERSGFGGNKLKFLAMGQGQEKVTIPLKKVLCSRKSRKKRTCVDLKLKLMLCVKIRAIFLGFRPAEHTVVYYMGYRLQTQLSGTAVTCSEQHNNQRD